MNAEQLADWLDDLFSSDGEPKKAAAMLRKQADRIEELEREKEFAQVIADGDKGIMNEQAALLRECRLALDTLLAQKPVLSGFKAGSTTLGNLRASLFEHRPRGVMGDTNAQ
jgi:hypothetical protein